MTQRQKHDHPKFRADRPQGPQPEITLPSTITAHNVMQAAGVTHCSEARSRYQRRRIRAWNLINREFLRELGARFVVRKCA